MKPIKPIDRLRDSIITKPIKPFGMLCYSIITEPIKPFGRVRDYIITQPIKWGFYNCSSHFYIIMALGSIWT